MTDKDIKDHCKNCSVEPPAMKFKCSECKHNSDKEQIIIDGVNISECEFLNASVFSGNSYWCNLFHDFCSATDYNYNYIHCFDKCPVCRLNKQLARKTQECEELKKELMRKDEVNTFFNTPTEGWSNNPCDICESKNNYDRYRKALEEIEAIVKDFNDNRLCFYDDINDCQNCDMNTDCNYLRKFKILDIINKAKGEGNEELYNSNNHSIDFIFRSGLCNKPKGVYI